MRGGGGRRGRAGDLNVVRSIARNTAALIPVEDVKSRLARPHSPVLVTPTVVRPQGPILLFPAVVLRQALRGRENCLDLVEVYTQTTVVLHQALRGRENCLDLVEVYTQTTVVFQQAFSRMNKLSRNNPLVVFCYRLL